MERSLIQEAGDAWKGGRINDALALYRQLASSGTTSEQQIGFQNGGACLRKLGKREEAITFLQQGLKKFPASGGLHHNLANTLRDVGGNHRWQALHHYRLAEKAGINSQSRVVMQAILWSELGYPALAYDCFCRWQKQTSIPLQIDSPDVVQVLLELATKLFEAEEADSVANWCIDRLNTLARDNPLNLLAQSISYARLGRIEAAVNAYRQTLELYARDQMAVDSDQQTTLINTSWNLACSLLKAGSMQAGWELYDFGLRAPAKPGQRWQRALSKLFSYKDIPLWRGEEIAKKRLLLLGEQAVGDTMMFLSLLPELLQKKATVTLAVSERLVPVYRRTYPELKVIDADSTILQTKEDIQPTDFDLQLPCGSLPKHCLKEILTRPDKERAILKPDPQKVAHFKQVYRKDHDSSRPIIGVSWLGGGRRDRIRIKSVPIEDFTTLLESTAARYVSIQYGDVNAQIHAWQEKGIDVVHSPDVDALKDIDTWLAQVAACDLVISVANTTIHGAGALRIPTLCLLNRNSDWRWVDGMHHSYWYPTVDCVVQDRRGSWQKALDECKLWVGDQWPKTKLAPRDYSRLDFSTPLYEAKNAG